ncbi:hypothetical protein RvY_00285 [Ramazzottius varieornatus]|uniref:Uncharacterized protein n=1 Tax=Ramazzottius varieornatus TaxID=947166 RepID=A0A1D1UCA0_RAMVA|nr:hypothetical protein RvY_00285 [Ramazzottius varieornatus]
MALCSSGSHLHPQLGCNWCLSADDLNLKKPGLSYPPARYLSDQSLIKQSPKKSDLIPDVHAEMLQVLALHSPNHSFLPNDGSRVHVEIITLLLFHAEEAGTASYTIPVFDTALADSRAFHQQVHLTQTLVGDLKYQRCDDLMDVSDDVLATFYFPNEDRWKRATTVVFLTIIADCDGHAATKLAAALGKLSISNLPATGFENRELWPTRVEATTGGKAGLMGFAKAFSGLMRHYNWSTVVFIAEAYRNPAMLGVAQAVSQMAGFMLHSNISVIQLDGYSPETDFRQVMREANRQARGKALHGSTIVCAHLLGSSKLRREVRADDVKVFPALYRHCINLRDPVKLSVENNAQTHWLTLCRNLLAANGAAAMRDWHTSGSSERQADVLRLAWVQAQPRLLHSSLLAGPAILQRLDSLPDSQPHVEEDRFDLFFLGQRLRPLTNLVKLRFCRPICPEIKLLCGQRTVLLQKAQSTQVDEERFKYDPTVSSTVQASQLKNFMRSKKDWTKALIKGMKLLFDEDELRDSCTKDKKRSPENREPLDQKKVKIIHDMVDMFCDGKKLTQPKSAEINKRIGTHCSGFRKKNKKIAPLPSV